MKVIPWVLKEIYIMDIEFREVDFELFIKSACAITSLIFDEWSIHCSTLLDFGTDVDYKIKILDFKNWGRSDKYLTTDWKIDYAYFSNIINAISRCGLKNSLRKINIYENPTLSKMKVQQMLKTCGLSHIAVLNEY